MGLLEEVLSVTMRFGGWLPDLLEQGVFALIGAVIAFDVWFGMRDRRVFAFTVLQVAGLIAGIAWVFWIGAQQDVAGPWAWALVTGVWWTLVVLFHLWRGARTIIRKLRGDQL